jgi:hypothetical protein
MYFHYQLVMTEATRKHQPLLDRTFFAVFP